MPAKKIKSVFVKLVTVVDPYTGDEVEIEIRKMETGSMVGIEGSYLDQDVGPVYSPYDKGREIDIPDDEEMIS